jgi:hypothetical protein
MATMKISYLTKAKLSLPLMLLPAATTKSKPFASAFFRDNRYGTKKTAKITQV